MIDIIDALNEKAILADLIMPHMSSYVDWIKIK